MKLSDLVAFLPFALTSPYPCHGVTLPLQQDVLASPGPGSPEYPLSYPQQSMANVLAGSNNSYSGYKGPGVYLIKNLQSGTCLDLWGGLAADSSKIAGWEQNGLDNQKWHIVEAGDGTVMLINNGTGTLAAATSPKSDIKGRVLPPHSLYLRWKMDDQAYRNFDGNPTRFINQATCEALTINRGEAHGNAITFPTDTKWPEQAYYLQLVPDPRSPCSSCSS